MTVTLNTGSGVNSTYSNGNKTVVATSTASDCVGIATAAASAGQKSYWEATLNGAPGDFSPGQAVLYAGGTRGNFPGVMVNGYLGGGDNYMLLGLGATGVAGIQGNAVVIGPDFAASIANGVILGFTVDYNGGTWGVNINGGSFYNYTIPTNDGAIFPAYEIEGGASSSASITFGFAAANQTYSPPAGYTPLDPGAASAALTGNSATGAIGSLGNTRSLALTGNAGTGSVGILGVAASAPLTGNQAIGSVGSVGPHISMGLSGNQATTAVGTLGTHILNHFTASDFTSATPVLGAPTLGQLNALTAQDFTSALPVLDFAILGQINHFTALDLTTNNPVLGHPILNGGSVVSGGFLTLMGYGN